MADSTVYPPGKDPNNLDDLKAFLGRTVQKLKELKVPRKRGYRNQKYLQKEGLELNKLADHIEMQIQKVAQTPPKYLGEHGEVAGRFYDFWVNGKEVSFKARGPLGGYYTHSKEEAAKELAEEYGGPMPEGKGPKGPGPSEEAEVPLTPSEPLPPEPPPKPPPPEPPPPPPPKPPVSLPPPNPVSQAERLRAILPQLGGGQPIPVQSIMSEVAAQSPSPGVALPVTRGPSRMSSIPDPEITNLAQIGLANKWPQAESIASLYSSLGSRAFSVQKFLHNALLNLFSEQYPAGMPASLTPEETVDWLIDVSRNKTTMNVNRIKRLEDVKDQIAADLKRIERQQVQAHHTPPFAPSTATTPSAVPPTPQVPTAIPPPGAPTAAPQTLSVGKEAMQSIVDMVNGSAPKPLALFPEATGLLNKWLEGEEPTERPRWAPLEELPGMKPPPEVPASPLAEAVSPQSAAANSEHPLMALLKRYAEKARGAATSELEEVPERTKGIANLLSRLASQGQKKIATGLSSPWAGAGLGGIGAGVQEYLDEQYPEDMTTPIPAKTDTLARSLGAAGIGAGAGAGLQALLSRLAQISSLAKLGPSVLGGLSGADLGQQAEESLMRAFGAKESHPWLRTAAGLGGGALGAFTPQGQAMMPMEDAIARIGGPILNRAAEYSTYEPAEVTPDVRAGLFNHLRKLPSPQSQRAEINRLLQKHSLPEVFSPESLEAPR